MKLPLSRSAILRVVVDLLEQELKAARGIPVREHPSVDMGAPGEIHLGDEGVALDSMETLTVAGVVNEFFHLHESGVEDYLLRRKHLSGWAEIIEHALGEGVSSVTFRTGGTSGSPKTVTHSWDSLLQEVAFLETLFGSRRRLVSTVPSHHIYGFLFTALLPERLGVAVHAIPWERIQEAGSQSAPGDLIVSHPTLWRYLGRSIGSWAPDVHGVSSTAPLPTELHQQLYDRGIDTLVEVYGSTETGGVGYRMRPGAPFTLFPYFHRGESGSAPVLMRRRPVTGEMEPVGIMDSLEWKDATRFLPTGRKDRTVQVGGENVSLDHVEQVLAEFPGVSQAVARLNEHSSDGRLKAFVVPTEGRQMDETELQEHLRRRLRPVERPLSVTVGNELPRTALGKLTDWPV